MHALSASSSSTTGAAVIAGHGCSSSKMGLSMCPRSLRRPSPLHFCSPMIASRQLNLGSCRSSYGVRVFAAESAVKTEKWLLQPIGDGDCSHLDEAVPLPGAFEVAAEAATVGRVPERADIVIPIATVSGLHARLERKGGTLFVTDLDSTNGTYINDRQIRPGAVTPVPPGSRVTFGDDHLAAFKFSKEEVAAA